QHRADNPNTGDVSARPVEAGDEPEFDWVCAGDKDDGNTRRRGLGCEHCRWSERADRRHLALDKIGRHCRQRIITIRYPAVFDRHTLTLDIAHFVETAAECSIEINGNRLRQAAEISDHRDRWLLRACRQRPHRCRAADERDELAPLHSITSSARSRNDSGMVSPIRFAVFMFTTSSNLTGASTGRSAAFAPPRRMRSM